MNEILKELHKLFLHFEKICQNRGMGRYQKSKTESKETSKHLQSCRKMVVVWYMMLSVEIE